MGYIHLRNRGRIDVQTLRARAALAVAVWIAWPGGVAGQTSGGAPDGYDLFAAEEWGEERDGLQLRLAAAWAVEERYAADGLLRLAVQVRNTSSAPIEFDFSAINYDIAYEIDGVWYERDNPTVMYPTVVAIPPGSVLSSALAIFVDDRYLLHGLSRIENGARSPLKLAAGPHVIRVRPGPTAFGAPVRNPPASNSVAITFPELDLQVEMDVAFWVQDRETKQHGVAILHSSLDELYLFGAGGSRPDRRTGFPNEIRVDAWHLLSAGHEEAQPIGDVREIGVVEGQPFTFEREALEFVNLGKSAFVLYWSGGRYWQFWTAD